MEYIPKNYQPYKRNDTHTDIVPSEYDYKPVTYQKDGKTFLKVKQ